LEKDNVSRDAAVLVWFFVAGRRVKNNILWEY
jgi:hypothetical protein